MVSLELAFQKHTYDVGMNALSLLLRLKTINSPATTAWKLLFNRSWSISITWAFICCSYCQSLSKAQFFGIRSDKDIKRHAPFLSASLYSWHHAKHPWELLPPLPRTDDPLRNSSSSQTSSQSFFTRHVLVALFLCVCLLYGMIASPW